jgi:hypothetical protein
MVKVLTKLRIDEVSAVDRGAGKNTKIVLLKRDDGFIDKARNDQNFRSVATGALYPRAGRSFLEVLDDLVSSQPAHTNDIDDDENDDDVGDDDADDVEKGVDHYASTVADLLVKAGSFPHRGAALHHLLRTNHGQALLTRLNKAVAKTEKDSTMDAIEIMKRHPLAFCKVVAEDGDAHGVSEHELVAALTKHASELHLNMSADKAFAKLYENPDVWRACAVAKAAPFNAAPVAVSGERARGGDVDPNNAEAAMEAYNELLALAAEYRRANPALSEAQAFSAVFTSRENAALAALAHRRPSA